MGTRSWIRGPALSRSRVPGILGMRARRNANFVQDRRNAEREETGMLISCSCGVKVNIPARDTKPYYLSPTHTYTPKSMLILINIM